MPYPKVPDYKEIAEKIALYTQLKHEHGAKGIAPLLSEAEEAMLKALEKVKDFPINTEKEKKEPSELHAIRELRPSGPRRILKTFDESTYSDKVEGALLGRMAGCTLGSPVEGMSVHEMEELAKQNKDTFPPTDYWSYIPGMYNKRYKVSKNISYTKGNINGVPADDDIAYMILNLLIYEHSGKGFDPEAIAKAWIKYLPFAFTSEKVTLKNLKEGVSYEKACELDNPYIEWIGGSIRADTWGYIAPGMPELAAEYAWRDATLSHRRQGIYGEMFFSALVSAAFVVDDIAEAVSIALSEIPRQSALAKAIKWSLTMKNDVQDYVDAYSAVDKKFRGMSKNHTINNACLTVFGLLIGKKDFTRTISETVAMGYDCDCNAATAGSVLGALLGKKGIPEHWTNGFNNTVHTYLNGKKLFTITNLIKRYVDAAKGNVG